MKNVNDIICRSTNESLYQDFSSYIHKELEMNLIGKFKFFLTINQAIKEGNFP